MLTVKNEYVLVISLALGFVYFRHRRLFRSSECSSSRRQERREAKYVPRVKHVTPWAPGLVAERDLPARTVRLVSSEGGSGCDFTDRWTAGGQGSQPKRTK